MKNEEKLTELVNHNGKGIAIQLIVVASTQDAYCSLGTTQSCSTCPGQVAISPTLTAVKGSTDHRQ